MTTLTIEIPDKDTELVVQVLKKFKVKIKDDKSYNPEFVAKIQKGVKARENGEKGLKVDLDDLWK